MSDNEPRPSARAATASATTSSSATPASTTTPANAAAAAAARFRLPPRQSSDGHSPSSPRPPLQPRRRSSLLSFSSIDDVTRSFTDNYINPRTSNRRRNDFDNETTSWHSSPLAFAILPALAGLFTKNGSAFVTDVLLLGLAAIFMNWSIRLPWDWYYSAQALRRDVEPDYDEDLGDETAVDTASSAGSSPKPSPARKHSGGEDASTQNVSKREQAAASLRKQELLALTATFTFPVLAAYLLHVIRAQLSGPSNGLVSDYNLSIFLLAAEIRPVRQVVRMVASRTMFLQRTVTGIDDPFASAIDDKSTTNKLAERITDLEAKLSEHAIVPPTMNMARKADVTDLSSEIRKRYESRLEGLERALRRYEKKTVTMSMNIDQRLVNLETRLQEALSLAAVAAQHSQNPGIVALALQTFSNIVAFPLKIAYSICIWPLVATEQLYNKTKSVLLGPAPPRSPRRKSSRHDARGRDDSRNQDRQSMRRPSREERPVRHT
ncbi:hypothetical protein Slin15195_G048890 [Septoria linicola]|uniref:Uncharacterized protein n=1 Tax=Septoria linicola TaxID=215465 RepID=A0A9Q9EI21_9PEZI|nr:hypothetical protein Slin15195_G048890 [Septoria linicola]